MRQLLLLLLSIACLACGTSEPEKQSNSNSGSVTPEDSVSTPPNAVDSTTLIIPGERLGELQLSVSPEKAFAQLGNPDAGDAAMGKALSTWYLDSTTNQKHQLNVFTVREKTGMPDEAVRVQQIRTSSPRFTLVGSSLAVGSTLSQIRTQFPQVKPVASVSAKGQPRLFVYDAQDQGIAFEITGPDSVCVAISIHAKGKSIADSYLPVHQNLTRIPQK